MTRTRTTRMAPWLCYRCGYLFDAASSLFADAVPKESDVSACMNCGAPLILRAGRFVQLTAGDWAALEPEVRRELTETQFAITHMHRTLGRPLGGKPRGNA